MNPKSGPTLAEHRRLADDAARRANWKRWGPYLAERQWGTVREDYSAEGDPWTAFPHDHARSRAYRWGEDGLLGFCDRQGRLCFALALWNERDSILKERLFGLTGPEGNHGEDVKECYYYLDSTPTHSYAKALYKYPQCEFPYDQLRREAGPARGKVGELELTDLGVFDDGRYFDVFTEYAKASPNDLLIRITIHNRGPDAAPLHVLPTLWFRNTWSWGRSGEGYWPKPSLTVVEPNHVLAEHDSLGRFHWYLDAADGATTELWFTDNETNAARLFNAANPHAFVKDAFHRRVIEGDQTAVNPQQVGTKAAAHWRFDIEPGAGVTLRLRLCEQAARTAAPFGDRFDPVFDERIAESDAFYDSVLPKRFDARQRVVARQAYAGLLWSKQFYYYVVDHWLEGDPSQPAPPPSHRHGRNHDWPHLYNRDVISMPDKWEYPWYAAWDLAFHMLPFAEIDPHFTKQQLVLFLREWYMHPAGQIPAYEFNFSDVNPPVHAWACWRVYKMTGPRGQRDRHFLARTFQKLLLNFTWWVNRKDPRDKNLFAGGFLGLDNIGPFDRSKPLPGGGHLEQADGTAWMAFYCINMLAMALELAEEDPAYEDLASKFFEHFIAIADAMNGLGGTGLWHEEDGFYYDQLLIDGRPEHLRVRSMVGLLPLCACGVLESHIIDKLPGFKKRTQWFLKNRPDLARHIACMEHEHGAKHDGQHLLLAIPSRQRLERTLQYMLDENEFLSPFGIRSLSRVHLDQPYVFRSHGRESAVRYVPGESDSNLFGGNSNWRGPVWLPVNYLLIEALERYHHFYGDELKVECPRGSGNMMDLRQVSQELAGRLARLCLPDEHGRRPCHGDAARYADDPAWKDLVLFYEYFHGDSGRGCGAGHQTGWTALVTRCLEKM